MTSRFVYVGDRIATPIENLTKFAPSETIQTKMIWFSDMICIHMYQILFKAFENYSTSLREFLPVLERFLVNLCCFVPAKHPWSFALKTRILMNVLMVTSSWSRTTSGVTSVSLCNSMINPWLPRKFKTLLLMPKKLEQRNHSKLFA